MSTDVEFRSGPDTRSCGLPRSLAAGPSRAKPAASARTLAWVADVLAISLWLSACGGGGGSPSAPGPGAGLSRFLGEWVGTYTDSNEGGTGDLTLVFRSLDGNTGLLEGGCAFDFSTDGRDYSVRQGRLTATGGGAPGRIVFDCLMPGGCGVRGNGELVNEHALGGVVTASVPADCGFARVGRVDLTKQ